MTDTTYHRILWGATGGAIAIILAAGLWPFDFRIPNAVTWEPDREGMTFGSNGIAFTYSPLYSRSTLSENRAISISMDLTPSKGLGGREGRIVSFYNPDDNREMLSIGQRSTHCIVHQHLSAGDDPTCTDITFRTLLKADTRRTFRITVDQTGIAMYRGDSLAGTASCMLKINPMALMRCKVILGNNPSATTPWEGTIGEIAISDIAPGATLDNRTQDPPQDGRSSEEQPEHAIANWKFGGQNTGGRIAFDYSGNNNSLSIPKQFRNSKTDNPGRPIQGPHPGPRGAAGPARKLSWIYPVRFCPLSPVCRCTVGAGPPRSGVGVTHQHNAQRWRRDHTIRPAGEAFTDVRCVLLNSIGAVSGALFLWRMRWVRE